MNIKLTLITIGILLSTNLFAQEFNTVITDEKTGKPMLVGYTTLEAFNDTSFSEWWNSAYNEYEVDSAVAEELKVKLQDVDIKIVMGTWCHHSRKKVPHFYKILDEINYPQEKVTLINVKRDKKGIEIESEGLVFNRIPTFIFYRNEKEIGRIVVKPKNTLEKNMLEILSVKSESCCVIASTQH
jgi:thiol-disulfide isomerase/thioredoxin